jgi:uncharacterized protein DUF350
MYARTLMFTVYELVASTVIGLITLFVCIKTINWSFLRQHRALEEMKTNIALSIFNGSMILAIMFLVNGSILPAVDALRAMVLARNDLSMEMIWTSLGYLLLFYVCALVISFIIVFLSARIYLWSTPLVDEIAEIKSDNIAVAVILSAVVIGLSLFVEPALDRFVSSLVDYDSMERIVLPAKKPPLPPAQSGEVVVPETRISPK